MSSGALNPFPLANRWQWNYCVTQLQQCWSKSNLLKILKQIIPFSVDMNVVHFREVAAVFFFRLFLSWTKMPIILEYQQLTLDNRSKCLDLTKVSFVFDWFYHFRYFVRCYIAGHVWTLSLVLKSRISVLSLYRLGYFSVDRLKPLLTALPGIDQWNVPCDVSDSFAPILPSPFAHSANGKFSNLHQCCWILMNYEWNMCVSKNVHCLLESCRSAMSKWGRHRVDS